MSEKYKSSIENTKTSQTNYNKIESISWKTNIDKNETKKANIVFDNFKNL